MDFDTIRIRDVNGQFVEYDLKEQLTINEYDLQSEFKLQASKYVYWASILEQVRGYLESSELTEEQTRAQLYEPARIALINAGTAKPTKDQVEAWILQQEEYISARQQVLIYNKYVKHLQYIVKAFEQRRDMMQQIGADKRRQTEYERNLNSL